MNRNTGLIKVCHIIELCDLDEVSKEWVDDKIDKFEKKNNAMLTNGIVNTKLIARSIGDSLMNDKQSIANNGIPSFGDAIHILDKHDDIANNCKEIGKALENKARINKARANADVHFSKTKNGVKATYNKVKAKANGIQAKTYSKAIEGIGKTNDALNKGIKVTTDYTNRTLDKAKNSSIVTKSKEVFYKTKDKGSNLLGAIKHKLS